MKHSPPGIWSFLAMDWHNLLIPMAILLGTLLLGFIARDILFRLLNRWSARSASPYPIILRSSLRGPLIIWALIFGIYFALESANLPARADLYLSKSLFGLWIISFTIMAVHLAGSLVKFYGRRNGSEMPATSLTRSIAQIAVASIGIAILLHHLGISITPLVTALGVGGLAVALALQDTLGNLFGGFYVTIAGQVRLGDYIRLNSGEEGYVVDISWRSTTLRTIAGNMIIVPNSKLSQAIVTNYYLPQKQMGISIDVGVSYNCDPEHVERVLLDVAAHAAAEVDGLTNSDQSVRLNHGFGESSLQFQLNVSIDEFARQYIVRHELTKRILKRFREENIEIPYPARTIYMRTPAQNT